MSDIIFFPMEQAFQLETRMTVTKTGVVTTEIRSGITSDPNRKNDPKYITRLVGQVITVSVETVALVEKISAVGVGEK